MFAASLARAQPSLPTSEPLVMSVAYPAEAGPKDAVESLIGVRKGERLSRRAVQRSIERLIATGRYADVVVRATDVMGGVALVFDIQLKRYLAHVYVDGEKVVSRDDVLKASKLSEGAEYYPDRLLEAARDVTELYRVRGYDEATVDAQPGETDEGLEVTLQIVEGPPTLVSALTFGGGPGLPVPQLERALGLDLGDVMNSEALAAGVDKLRGRYRTEHYYKAQLGEPVIERSGTQAQIYLPVTAGPQFNIQFHGNRSYPRAVLSEAVGYDGIEAIEPGVMAQLAQRLTAFYRSRGFYDARVTAHETEAPDHRRALLVFEVDEGTALFVKDIAFAGNATLSTKDLLELLVEHVRDRAPRVTGADRPLQDPFEDDAHGRAPEPDPDPRNVFVDGAYLEAAQLMEEAYQARGFLDAHVEVARVDIDVRNRSANVRFQVTEGQQTHIAQIKIENSPPGFAAGPVLGLDVGDVLEGGAMERARAALLRALHHGGYYFATVDAQADTTEAARAHLTFRITSGPAVRVGKIIIRGSVRSKEAFIRTNLKVREGQLLDPEVIDQSQTALINLADFDEATVRLLSPDRVEPVKDVVVELVDSARLKSKTGIGWTAVDGILLRQELTFPNFSLPFVGATETNATIRGQLSYVKSSLLWLTPGLSGTFDKTALNEKSDLAAVGGLVNAAIEHPVISWWADQGLPGRLGWRADVVADRVFLPAYFFYDGLVVLGTSWTWRWLTVSVQEQPEIDHLEAPGTIQSILPSLTPADQVRLRFPIGNFILQNLREAVTIDFRDNAADPHKGVIFTTQAEETHAIDDETQNGFVPITTVKLQGNLTGYVPIDSKRVLALSVRAGRILPVNPESQTIAPKRFFLGGSSTMRGFGEDAVTPQDVREAYDAQVQQCRSLASPAGCTQPAAALTAGEQLPSSGGEAFELAKAELRFSSFLFSSLGLGLFVEAGNLWLDPTQMKFNPVHNTYRYVAGVDLRLPTPIGAVAIGVGFNLAPDVLVNEQLANLNFSVGGF